MSVWALGIGPLWRATKAVFADVWRFLDEGVELPSRGHRAFEHDLREMCRPYLAVLRHKREKLFEQDADAAEGRWLSELDFFQERVLWPMLGTDADYAARHRRHVIHLIDHFVADTDLEHSAGFVPITSAFDSHWAA